MALLERKAQVRSAAAQTEKRTRSLTAVAAEQVRMAVEGLRPTMTINPETWNA